MHRIVILGGGTGGTLAANRLRKVYGPDQAVITVVDQDDFHVYQHGLLFIPFGVGTTKAIKRPRREQSHTGINYLSTASRKSNEVRTRCVSSMERTWRTTCW